MLRQPRDIVYQFVLFSKAGLLEEADLLDTDPAPNTDQEDWIFHDIDRIFETVKEDLGLETDQYDLFGHSAGGQILHRLALFAPPTRAHRILAANSGWYTLPTFEQDFPYGVAGTGLTREQLAQAFGTDLVVFLGEKDDENETRGSLRRTPGANRQGSHRLARGTHFFERAREAAHAMDADFEWSSEIVPGVGHDYRRMSEAAARYLYDSEPSK